jgi:hypothetical protein
MKDNTNTMLAAALNIAKHYPVFACKPDTKAPHTPNGFKDATVVAPERPDTVTSFREPR